MLDKAPRPLKGPKLRLGIVLLHPSIPPSLHLSTSPFLPTAHDLVCVLQLTRVACAFNAVRNTETMSKRERKGRKKSKRKRERWKGRWRERNVGAD